MKITLDMLNENQRQAVEWGGGPLLVLAGPGAGKTAVLTQRIINLIEKTPDDSFRILGLTFTVKAANEMQNRIRERLGSDFKRVQLMTFHSFCADILGRHGSQLGIRPDFEVITDDNDRVAILKELTANGQVEIDDPEGALKQIDTMFTHGIDTSELSRYFETEEEDQCRLLRTIFESYVGSLVKENRLDFGSMLYLTRKLLTDRPRIAQLVRTVYRYVCVDEFQDTNQAQYKVLRLLCPEQNSNLFVVADDDQIIFQWNGADPKRLEELKNDYALKIIQLPENFRCPAKVVEIANRLIAQNQGRISSKKDGVSHKTELGEINVMDFNDFEEEVGGLISKIESIPRNQREKCLVIARSNKLLMEVKNAMDKKEMKAEIVSKQQNFTSLLVQLMYYSMKLANAPESRSLLNKLCSSASRFDGTPLSAEDVVTAARVKGITFLRAFFSLLSSRKELKAFSDNGMFLLCDVLNYEAFVKEALQLFDAIIQTDEGKEEFPDYQEDKENWTRIADQIHSTHNDSVSLHVFLREMDLSPKAKVLSNDCVRLQTVHTAKGLESENVFIIGLAEDQFPTFFAIKKGDSAIEEERRNCFVAVTRSSKNLYLSFAGEYFGRGSQPSRFLKEMQLI